MNKNMLLIASVLYSSMSLADAIPAGTMNAHYIDMGQADATLLEFSCGAVLIDAGAQYDNRSSNQARNFNRQQTGRLTGYLTDFFERRDDLNETLDAIYITHNHIDHTHALREVAEAFTVENYIGTGETSGLPEAVRDTDWIRSEPEINKDIITSDKFDDDSYPQGYSSSIVDPLYCGLTNPDIRILSGLHKTNPGWSLREFENVNNHSLVIRVDFGQASFLFTGDLEEDGIEHLIESYQEYPSMLDIDVYQVGHHGSYNATNVDLLEALTPEIAVISAGKWDYGRPNTPFTTYQYGHPRKNVVDLLALSIEFDRDPTQGKVFTAPRDDNEWYDVDDAVFSTSWDETVIIEATFDGQFSVSTGN